MISAGVLPHSVRSMLEDAVDYAGLFPPAGLSMAEAVRSYAVHRASDQHWALGRFVLPMARLTEFVGEVSTLLPRTASDNAHLPWRLSVLAGTEPAEERARIEAFNAQWQGRVVIDAVEARATNALDIVRLAPLRPSGGTLYVECPLGPGVTACVAAVGSIAACAKVRTGGVTPDAFPSPALLADFIVACAAHRVPFKATAGLHHPMRASYRLSYESGAAHGVMFGFVNVFLATALAQQGAPSSDVASLLDERDATAIQFTDDAATWRSYRVSDAPRGFGRALIRGFGSCSFQEPMDEIVELMSMSHA